MAEGYRLASAGGDVKIWDMPGHLLWKTLDSHSQAVSSLSWSPTHPYLATAAADKVVLTTLKGPVANTMDIVAGEDHSCVTFSSNSRFLFMGGKKKDLSMWDLKTQSPRKTYPGHMDDVTCLTLNYNDQMSASGALNGNILFHNITSGQASEPLRRPETQAVHAVQFSSFQKSILGAVSDDGALNCWDSNTRKLVTSFSGDHKAPATALSFSPSNHLLFASVGLDKKLIFYDIQDKKALKVVNTESPLTSVALCHDGLTVAVGSTKGKIYVYDLRSGSSPVSSTTAHKTLVQCLAFQPPSAVGSKGSSNALSSKVTKPAPAKQPTRRLPTPQVAVPAPNNATPAVDGDYNTHRTHTQQNGVVEEDIFSPLREVKTPVASSATADRAGLGGDPEIGPTDGVFSPLSSGTTSLHVRHHPVGAPSALSSARRANAETRPQVPRTTGEATPSARLDVVAPPDIIAPSLGQEGMLGGAMERRPLTEERKPPVEERRRNEGSVSSEEGGGERRRLSDTPPPAFSRSPAMRIRHGSSPDVSPSMARRARMGSQGASNASQVSPGTAERSAVPVPMATVAGATERASGSSSAESAGLAPFQVQFIKNMIEDSLEEFKFSIHRDLVNVQVEMLRQFQIQQNELKALMEKYSMNEALVLEIQRLKEENERLKTKY